MNSTRTLASDLDQAVEQLAIEASGGPDYADETPLPDRLYSEPVRGFVYQLVRDLVELKRETDFSKERFPMADVVFFRALREEYSLEPGTDLLVVSHLSDAVAGQEISRIDHFLATVFIYPFAFRHPSRQEEFGEHLRAGREDLAARLVVQTVYDLFEMPQEDFEASLRRGVPGVPSEQKALLDQLLDPDQPDPEGIDADQFLDELSDLESDEPPEEPPAEWMQHVPEDLWNDPTEAWRAYIQQGEDDVEAGDGGVNDDV